MAGRRFSSREFWPGREAPSKIRAIFGSIGDEYTASKRVTLLVKLDFCLGHISRDVWWDSDMEQ